LSEEEKIKKLKEAALNEEDPDIIKEMIDALTNYGKLAIDAILEIIIAKTEEKEVEKYGLDAIKRITKKNSNAWGFTKV